MTQAINTKGIILAVGTGVISASATLDTYTDLCNVLSIEDSGDTSEEIDVTTLTSVAREFMQGLADFGTVTMTINWLPGYDAQKKLMALKADGKESFFRISYPSDGVSGGAYTEYFKARVTNVSKSIAVGAQVQATVTLRKSSGNTAA